MAADREYRLHLSWEGNRGTGTSGPREFSRASTLHAAGKASIPVSADVPFRGDRDRWNPEELLLGALAECHMLSYFYVATRRGFIVEEYSDDPLGYLREDGRGSGAFSRAVLRPRVRIAHADGLAAARAGHTEAHELCFIANSLAFPVEIEADVTVRDAVARSADAAQTAETTSARDAEPRA